MTWCDSISDASIFDSEPIFLIAKQRWHTNRWAFTNKYWLGRTVNKGEAVRSSRNSLPSRPSSERLAAVWTLCRAAVV
jgi:hypothetical protein